MWADSMGTDPRLEAIDVLVEDNGVGTCFTSKAQHLIEEVAVDADQDPLGDGSRHEAVHSLDGLMGVHPASLEVVL